MANELVTKHKPVTITGDLFTNVEKFEHAQRVAKVFSSSTMVPAHFQGERNIGNVLIAFNYADRIKADPFMVMQNMCVINGKPGIEAKLVIALLNNCGRFDPLEFEEIGDLNEPKKNDDGCIAIAKEIKSGKVLKGPKIDWRMVKAEGWYQKNGSKWKTLARLMFRYRSAAYFARIYAPEVLLGMQTREELVDVYEMHPTKTGTYEYDQEKPDFSDEELIKRFDEKTSTLSMINEFLTQLATAQEITVDDAKAQIMAEGDIENMITNYRRWESTQQSNVPDISEDKKTNNNLPWNPETEEYKQRYDQVKIEIMKTWLDNKSIDRRGCRTGRELHELIRPPQQEPSSEGEENQSVDKPTIEIMERFNTIFISQRNTPEWFYAQEKVTGDGNNSFRPPQEKISLWLEYYDRHNRDTQTDEGAENPFDDNGF